MHSLRTQDKDKLAKCSPNDRAKYMAKLSDLGKALRRQAERVSELKQVYITWGTSHGRAWEICNVTANHISPLRACARRCCRPMPSHLLVFVAKRQVLDGIKEEIKDQFQNRVNMQVPVTFRTQRSFSVKSPQDCKSPRLSRSASLKQ